MFSELNLVKEDLYWALERRCSQVKICLNQVPESLR